MTHQLSKKSALSWFAGLLVAGSVYACGSTTGGSGTGNSGPGSSTGTTGAPGSACSSDAECASGTCSARVCTDGSGAGSGGSTGSGSGGSGGSLGSGSGAPVNTPGPHFTGTGNGFRPLTAGCGPDTADLCTGTCEQAGGDPTVTIIRPPATLCFSGTGDPTPDDPSVVIEQVVESVGGKEYVHIRVTFDPAFVDNTYGEGSCCGWSEARGHWFRDLTGSDHTELLLTDGTGATVIHFKVDFITEDPASPCGYGTLGVAGGEGEVLVGNADYVLATATSLDRNLNGCGYCESSACASSGDCTVDSPATDANFTPNAGTPDWDYRQVYEVWIDMAAFNNQGFGQAYITYTHASPAKAQDDTIDLMGSPCPPQWDTPYCPPGVIQEGGNCFGDNDDDPCPPNEQTYITSEGQTICTPIPYVNYDGMAPCPTGYVLDLASEGQYCVPAS